MAITAINALSLSPLLYLGGLGFILAPWLVRLPRLAIIFLMFSLVSGQILRLPLPGQGGGLLLSDLATIIVLMAALLQTHHRRLPVTSYQLPVTVTITITPFILWSLFTLLIRLPDLGLINSAIAASYWIRLASTLLLLPALLVLFQDDRVRHLARRAFVVAIILILLLGLIQYLFFSDFSLLAASGWDPHQRRLTSTWLDPNFLGGFLAVTIWYLVHLALASRRRVLWLLVLLQFTALLLTQSRGSLISLIITAILLSPLFILSQLRGSRSPRPRQLAIILNLIILLIILSGFILRQRLLGLLSLDPTSSLRLLALKAAWPLAADNVFLGVGYNTYQFTALRAGLIKDFTIHSRAGTDNSLLTLWITTGLMGVIAFIIPWIYLVNRFLINWWRRPALPPLLAIGSILTLFIHSQFINSLLYSHLLITIILIVTLIITTRPPTHSGHSHAIQGLASLT